MHERTATGPVRTIRLLYDGGQGFESPRLYSQNVQICR
jgi:hypothetical protein